LVPRWGGGIKKKREIGEAHTGIWIGGPPQGEERVRSAKGGDFIGGYAGGQATRPFARFAPVRETLESSKKTGGGGKEGKGLTDQGVIKQGAKDGGEMGCGKTSLGTTVSSTVLQIFLS